MNPQRYVGQGLGHVTGLRQVSQEVAAKAVEHIQIAGVRRVNHFGGRHPGPIGDIEAVLAGQFPGILRIDRHAAGERRRVRAHLRATLHR